jgi:hypothetical protein
VILLDTRALIWWADGMGETLTPRARQPLDQERARVRRGEADAGLLVAAISGWEVERWLALVAAIPALPVVKALTVTCHLADGIRIGIRTSASWHGLIPHVHQGVQGPDPGCSSIKIRPRRRA